MNVAKKLSELNIQLPAAPDPVGAYVAFKKVGNMLFISGQLPIGSDGKIIKGKIGKELTLEAIKGAPETYDIKSLLKQWQLLDNPNAQWPVYDRTLHEPVSDKIVLKSEVLLLEGNWVLLDEGNWRVLSAQADLTIFLRAGEEQVCERLKARKKRGGFSLEEVEAHYLRTDRPNVYRVLTKSLPADLELIWTTDTEPSQLAFRASQDFDII